LLSLKEIVLVVTYIDVQNTAYKKIKSIIVVTK